MICPRLTTSVSGGLDVWQHHRQRWILPWLYIPPSVSRLGPLMIGACVVSKHSPCPERSSLYPNTHTHTLTTAMSHLSNSSVRDHMKWVSVFSLLHLHFLHLSTFVWNRRPSFSFAWLLCVLTFCDSLSQSWRLRHTECFKSNGVDLTKTVKNVSGLCFSPKLYFAQGKLSLF